MFVTVDGHAVYAASGGRAFDPALPLVLFLHGAGLDHNVWALHSRWFAHHGHTVLAVDLPGHGRSAGAALADIAALADWTVRLIEAAGFDRAILIGHSMGSLIALEAAARHPHRIAGLGLIGAAPAMPVHADLLAAAAADDHAAIDMVCLWGHGTRATQGGSRAPGQWMLGTAQRLLEQAASGVLHTDLAACHAYQDGPAAAAKVTCPAVLVLGERDVMTPLKAGRALAAAIASSHTVVLPGAGHMLMAECPDAVLDALQGLLSGLLR
jgi:pimeloyl-ACP methyl ester carboxylesterase